jgi:NAD(P)-dependent dehydrogenase (short-subunit alcohol dehydrogenase family)
VSMRKAPPFRADRVGSLLRPPELLAARGQFADETIGIAETVGMQESVGLQSVTDGELGQCDCLTKWGIGAFAEVLCREIVGSGVRVILIEPGRVESELRAHVRQEVIDELGPGFAALVGLDADVIANTIVFASAQPANVSFSEILVRPTASAM